ncbi:MAG TPA: YbhB/YbcL family Raf kinase inhibitor-like protein, partial [Candidatus Limnocylindrales bacterium]|nr:YbhB/YbcL family Raf kinase inhibitor-like protein [Candidatus Limnocylindrales bacterium]
MARFTLRTPSWLVAVVALAALAIGCGASSAATAPAGASGAPTVPATASANASQGGASTMSLEPSAAPSGSFASPTPSGRFALTSPAFDDGGSIPRESTCDGPDRSPELRWSGAPPGTAAFALEVVDPDARDFVHWLVFDLAGAPAGRVPANVGTGPGAPQQGRTGFGRIGWGGPCPPSGTH